MQPQISLPDLHQINFIQYCLKPPPLLHQENPHLKHHLPAVVCPSSSRTDRTALTFSCPNNLLCTELFSHSSLLMTMIFLQLCLPHLAFETLVHQVQHLRGAPFSHQVCSCSFSRKQRTRKGAWQLEVTRIGYINLIFYGMQFTQPVGVKFNSHYIFKIYFQVLLSSRK